MISMPNFLYLAIQNILDALLYLFFSSKIATPTIVLKNNLHSIAGLWTLEDK